MIRRSRINPIRRTPRRGRVLDPIYLAWVLTQSSIVRTHDPKCRGCWITIHHVRRFGEPKSDLRIVPLWACRHMRGFGDQTVEHGKVVFERLFNVILEDEIIKLRLRYREENESR